MISILIVEDDTTCRRLLARFLSAYSYRVQEASCVREACDCRRDDDPDLVIMDWMLGDSMDGIELVQSMRQDGWQGKVILITGYPSTELERQVKERNVDYYLTKPFEPTELLATVRQAIGIGN